MKKSSMIFRIICMAVCFALCISVINIVAEETTVEETVTETAEDVATEIEEASIAEEDEVPTGADEEEVSTEPEEATEACDEVVDLFTATLRDGGVYVTPGEGNAAVFNYDGVRYRVEAGAANYIRLDGFESEVEINQEITETAKNALKANGSISTTAAHSGYFGLAVETGDVVYRTAVTGDDVYVFSAWLKMPQSSSIDDEGHDFKVVGESGNVYVVGHNEIGRTIEPTGSWQQVLFTFRAPETGLFTIDFNYKGSETLSMDDIELYEAEVFENPITIRKTVCTDSEGNSYTASTGFNTSGTLTHTTVLYNQDEDDVFFNAIMVLYKDDIMIDFECIEDCALVLDETEVTFEIEIPQDEDLSKYKYMVYFVSDTAPTHFYGTVPSRTNPYIVKGN